MGEAGYDSTITGHEERLPVTVDVLAAKGCDLMVLGLVEEMVGRGVVKVVETGREAVGGGEVLMRRGMGIVEGGN